MEKSNYSSVIGNAILPSKLSEMEEKDLFLRFNNGDNNAREKIIKHNLKSVIYEINKKFTYWYEHGFIDKEELFSVGVIGLIKAVDTFDINKNYKFVSYSTICIDNEIRMFIRSMKFNNCVLSLESDSNKKDGFIGDKISDGSDFVDDILTKEEYVLIDQIINNLPSEEKNIIRMYFGFDGKRFKQGEISKIYNITQSYVSRIINKILKKIEIELLNMDVYGKRYIKTK